MRRARTIITGTLLIWSSPAWAGWSAPGDYLIFGHGFGEESIVAGPYSSADACKTDAHVLNGRLKLEYTKDESTVFFCEHLEENDTTLSSVDRQEIERTYLNPE